MDERGSRLKRPRALFKLWLFAAFFLPLTLSLGVWQLNRAEEKSRLLEAHTAQRSSPVIDGPPVGEPEPFRSYRLRGRYLSPQFLLDNRTRHGRVGYEVLTPFVYESVRASERQLLLINRGWVAAPAYRSEIPEFARPEPGPTVTLTGYFYPRSVAPAGYPAEELVAGQILRIQDLDWAVLLAELSRESVASDLKGAPGRDEILRTEQILSLIRQGQVVQQEFRLADSEQPGALQVDWALVQMGPEKHLGYAWQWFGLSAALVVLTGFASWRIWREA